MRNVLHCNFANIREKMLMYYTVHVAPNNFCITVSVMNVQYTQGQPFDVKSVHASLKARTILFEHLFVFLPTKKR